MGADELTPADYGVTLKAEPGSAKVGDTITYTATITNAGPADLSGVNVSFSPGSGLQEKAAPAPFALASGASKTVTVSYVATTPGDKAVTATVGGPAIDPTTGDHSATATAKITQDAPPATTPQQQQEPDVVTNQVCGSKRSFTITLRKLKGITFKKATIVVNGKKAKVRKVKGRFTAKIDLRKIGRKTIKVKIRAVTTKGKVMKGTRTYHPCRPSFKPKTTPKL
jgi:uncharacterized repeat protein (TIGR01451 family)